MSVQYMAPGLEPTTFGTRVPSHNHYTRVPARLVFVSYNFMGSGCGSVGRAVASKSRGPQFESCQWQKIILNITCQVYWKDVNKEKEAGNRPFLKKLVTVRGGTAAVYLSTSVTRWLTKYLVQCLANYEDLSKTKICLSRFKTLANT